MENGKIDIYVESDEPELKKTGISEEDAKAAIEKSLKAVGWVADKTKKIFKELPIPDRPNEAEIEFGVKIGAKGGIIAFVQGETDFHIKVKLTWKNITSDKEQKIK